jgi:hypothetical protein
MSFAPAAGGLKTRERQMIVRNPLQCSTCGHKTVTRSATGHGDYQEFAFPCGGCGLEIRFGMKLPLNRRMARVLSQKDKHPESWFNEQIQRIGKMQNLKFVNLKNAKECDDNPTISDTRTFDGETLNPIVEGQHFSPHMATAFMPKDREKFGRQQYVRRMAAEKFWPQLHKLLTHFERKRWDLFDKQLKELDLDLNPTTVIERIKAAFTAIESWEQVFAPDVQKSKEAVLKRIVLARATSRPLLNDLADYFKAKGKDETISRELHSIRSKWAKYYSFLSPIYLSFCWDDKKYSLKDYTLAEKRFDELNLFYVECFETLCRISVIAGAMEGIIHNKVLGIPITKRLVSLDEFDVMANGSKPDILKQLKIADLFVPYIDNKLRNGIGHNTAHYDVKSDSIKYRNENKSGFTDFEIPYIEFCTKIVHLFRQLHVVSQYAHWLRQSALGVPQ